MGKVKVAATGARIGGSAWAAGASAFLLAVSRGDPTGLAYLPIYAIATFAIIRSPFLGVDRTGRTARRVVVPPVQVRRGRDRSC